MKPIEPTFTIYLKSILAFAITSFLISMTIHYFQTRKAAHQTEQLMNTISAITAAADNISLGSADGYTNVTITNMAPILGSANMNAPWGEPIRFSSETATTYTVTIPKPSEAVCKAMMAKLKENSKYTHISCNEEALTYTYNSTS